MSRVVVETSRLTLRLAEPADAAFICSLWNDPRVMRFVGFPNGLGETEERLRANIEKRGASLYLSSNSRHLVERARKRT